METTSSFHIQKNASIIIILYSGSLGEENIHIHGVVRK